MQLLQYFYLFNILLLSTNCARVERYILSIDAHDEDCYFERVEDQTVVYFHFTVTEGGFLDIDYQLTFPNQTVKSGDRLTEESVQFESYEPGRFTFCFSNKMSTLTPKEIHLTLIIMKIKTFELLQHEDRMSTKNQTAERLMEELTMKLEEFDGGNYALLASQRQHHEINERTNKWIFWWSLFEALMLVSLSLGQVYYIKKYFEVTTFI